MIQLSPNSLPRLTQKATLEKQDIVTGKVPLTPIQRWFFQNHSGELHHFNQAVLLRSKKRLDHNRLRTVLQKLQAHHDALRMTFQYKMDHTSALLETDIVQQNAGLEHPFYFQVVDFKGNPDEIALLTSHAQSRQKAFDLQTGPLMQAVLYRLTDSDRLLIIIHHLVVDGVSWRILLEDIEQGYRQAEVGSQIDFGPKTASFKQWAEILVC
ncbi:MAG: hypothetical protein DRR00_11120 [Candidatus Parabeggiatoa sp. nov. 3]|nr:MAG: hypothetical protein DRR00_11120 [Gammaproteobacteria bacterium]RKZ56305.1 MAG: hypothetical protein DRQ99_28720 [Gammaproteobacteria bacterium]